MRLILYLVTSLVVAAMIFAVLIMTDVLRFKSNSAVTEQQAVRKKITSNVVVAEPEIVVGKTAIDATPKSMRTDGRGSMDEPMMGSTNSQGMITHGLSSAVHAKALEFLSAHAEKGEADIEDKFEQFLVGECNVDQKMAARMIRMSFWKNFVTLQDKWKVGEGDMLRVSFAMETELKRAGFAARGLSIMSGEMSMAEDELVKLENQLSANIPEENK